MKTTVVPAQITTVEDKVAGNLSFTQLLLLVLPVFVIGAIFALLPPLFNFSLLKLATSIVVAVLCMSLAIRIKGKILMSWIAVITKYRLRPMYYLFNKNEAHLRTHVSQLEPEPETKQQLETDGEKLAPALISTQELVRLQTAVDDPRANFHFKVRKGGLRVHIREVKKEGI